MYEIFIYLCLFRKEKCSHEWLLYLVYYKVENKVYVDFILFTACNEGSSDAESDPCSMGISTRSLGISQHYSGYNDWRVNDNFLDWHGGEKRQGLHQGQPAYGSPSVWTSNDNTSPGYQSLNTYVPHPYYNVQLYYCPAGRNNNII